MSRLVAWLRADLGKMNTPGEIVGTIRRYPTILVLAAIELVVGLAVIYGGLALFGAKDSFGDWAFLAILWAGLSAGRMVERRKPSLRSPERPSDDLADD